MECTMHEKRIAYKMIDRILDHPGNGGLDLRGRIERRKRLQGMTPRELTRELEVLNGVREKPRFR